MKLTKTPVSPPRGMCVCACVAVCSDMVRRFKTMSIFWACGDFVAKTVFSLVRRYPPVLYAAYNNYPAELDALLSNNEFSDPDVRGNGQETVHVRAGMA